MSIHRPHATKTSRTTPAQVMQCLTHTPPLAKVAQELGHTSTCTLHSDACAFCLVETHIRQSLEQAGGLTEPKDIYRNLRSFAPSFHHGRQEDAHELLRVAIEAMHQSCMTLIGRTVDGACAGGSARVRERPCEGGHGERERVSVHPRSTTSTRGGGGDVPACPTNHHPSCSPRFLRPCLLQNQARGERDREIEREESSGGLMRAGCVLVQAPRHWAPRARTRSRPR